MSLSDVSQRAPIERFDVVTVSRRDGSRQLWAECIERHRADAYAENLRRILDDAALPAGDVEILVELTGAILVRSGLQFSEELLLHEPMDEGPTDA